MFRVWDLENGLRVLSLGLGFWVLGVGFNKLAAVLCILGCLQRQDLKPPLSSSRAPRKTEATLRALKRP